MATVEAVARPQYVRSPRRGPITRLLEDERWLASFLMLPTIVLLGLFIAYPFFKGHRAVGHQHDGRGPRQVRRAR